MKDFKDLLFQIGEVVDDVNQKEFAFADSTTVPNINDTRLTFESSADKNGLHIRTCVLYVDIRNSVKMTEEHSITKMGKVFTAFTKAVLLIAYKCNGYVRNIIGDRVMLIFPEENCFQNAVDCAISINHVAKYVLDKKIDGIDFQCGIGIDNGDMYCIKVGIEKHGDENDENKRLIWVGEPANHASRLTDNANKEYSEIKYRVINYFRQRHLMPKRNSSVILPPSYTTATREEEMSGDEAIKKIMSGQSQQIVPLAKGEAYKFPPILISEAVYEGFKKACPNDNSIQNGWWKKTKQKIRDIEYDVYGADLIWKMD